ncbi:sulfotransferase family 2 domain-containing protein [Pseudoalteromonas sp. Hal040]|uniref:sulfotransferase family 2 domain-containing protein n=1 Tax=unclassified Pseudoalteromonas TaxID=194690 RepID=UPI00301DF679
MMLNNPINHFNVNELRQVSLKAYMLRNLLPTHLLESGRELIKGEGVYYSRAFDETKSIFIHIPKAAGTSVSNALYGGRQGHHTAIAMKKANPRKFKEYYKFSIVRNPWDRIASTYHYLLKSPHQEDRKWAEANIAKYDSFEKFVMHWLSTESVYTWKHLLPQTFFLNDKKERLIPDVFKLENLNESFEVIKTKVNSSATLKHDNKVARVHYSELYTPQMIKHVRSVYRSDVDEFQYEF